MTDHIEVGDVVRLAGSLPGAAPWTVIRIGTVGEPGDRAKVATVLRDHAMSGVEKQLVNVHALRRVEYREAD